MPIKECPNKHYFNGDKYGDTCPVCGLTLAKGLEAGETKEETEARLVLPPERYVCAWLVCTRGINRGRAYPVHSGKNFVGGGDDMDIQILGDDKVDLWRHAVLVFDEKKNETVLLPGESAGIVYLEKNAVYTPKPLQKFARIEIGDSEFLFAPLCDESFGWRE
jgi:hypothetical protein